MKNKISFNGSVKTFWIFCFQIIDEHESMVHITIRHVNSIIIVIHACSLLRTLLLLWCIEKSILLGMGINIIEAIISTNGSLPLDLKMLFSQEINTTWQENYGSNNLHQWELTYELEKVLFAKDNLYYHTDECFYLIEKLRSVLEIFTIWYLYQSFNFKIYDVNMSINIYDKLPTSLISLDWYAVRWRKLIYFLRKWRVYFSWFPWNIPELETNSSPFFPI